MREIWVRIVAAASGLAVVLLALAFAWSQNPRSTAQPAVAPVAPATVVAEAGRAVFEAQGCAMCHAVAGKGNPRSPLDGVGARHDAVALRDWTLATGSAESTLSTRAKVMKEDYRELSPTELDALIAYLQSLRVSPHDSSDMDRSK
jgi:mono/diheme cytochrome c family protein